MSRKHTACVACGYAIPTANKNKMDIFPKTFNFDSYTIQ